MSDRLKFASLLSAFLLLALFLALALVVIPGGIGSFGALHAGAQDRLVDSIQLRTIR